MPPPIVGNGVKVAPRAHGPCGSHVNARIGLSRVLKCSPQLNHKAETDKQQQEQTQPGFMQPCKGRGRQSGVRYFRAYLS